MTVTASPRTVADIVGEFLPADPTFDLTAEPWIDVTDVADGTRRTVGLRELLSDAHRVRLDPSRHGLLWGHAMTRLTVLLGYLVRYEAPDHDYWNRITAGDVSLPSDAVDTVLGTLADRLWLLHPTTPFLQHLPVLELMDAKAKRTPADTLDAATHPVWTLAPDVPAKTNTAWFGRADQRDTLTQADLASLLLLRHVFAMPGNEQPNWGAAGGREASRPSNRSEGGVTGLTHNGKALAHLTGPTLAGTIARNQLERTVRRTRGRTFLHDATPPADPAKADPLWWLMAAPATTVLIPAPHDPDGWRVVRTPMPWPTLVAKAVSTGIVRNDPFGLRVDPKTAASRVDPGFSQVNVSAAAGDLNAVRTFLKDTVKSESGLLDPTVLSQDALANDVPGQVRSATVTIIDGAGGATGPRIGGVAALHPPTTLDLPRERAAWWLRRVDQISHAKGAASRIVFRHVHLTLAGVATRDVPDRLPTAPDGLWRRCDEEMMRRTEPFLLDLLADTAGVGQLVELPSPQQAAAVATAAMDLFDELTAPVAARPASAAARAVQRAAVRNRVRHLMETTP